MYEHFKNDFMTEIINIVDTTALQQIMDKLDKVSTNYTITTRQTSVALYDANTIPDLVKTYLVCKKMEGLSQGTLYNYSKCLQLFFTAMRKQPSEITTNDIRGYLFWYQKERNISNRSLDKVRMGICVFFEWAFNEEYISMNPAKHLKPIKYEVTPRQSLTQIELEQIRCCLKNDREKAIIEVLYSTGCRVSELTALKKSDIDWITKQVHLFGKGSKHRISFLNAKAEVALKRYLNGRKDNNEFLFVSCRAPHDQIKKAAVEKIVREICDRVKGTIGKDFTPHILRHANATNALNSGMSIENVSKLLGHSSLNTTMIYAEVNMENVAQEHKKYIV